MIRSLTSARLTSVRRIPLHLGEDLDDALAGQARTRVISKAALIREYLSRQRR